MMFGDVVWFGSGTLDQLSRTLGGGVKLDKQIQVRGQDTFFSTICLQFFPHLGKDTGVFIGSGRNYQKALNVSQPSVSRCNQRCHSSFNKQPDEGT